MLLKIPLSKLLLIIIIFSFPTLSVSAELPRIAIKESKIDGKIGGYSRKHLNLQALLSEMEYAINNTRKFTVLTRDKARLSAIREEQEFSQSSLSKGNAADKGLLESANFLILPSIQDFKFYTSNKEVPNLNSKYFRTDHGMMEVQAQIIDTTSGQMKASFYMKSKFSTKREMVNKKGGAPNSIHFTRMAKDISTQMADQLVETVFPMKVVKAKGQHLTVNRGKDGGLKKGAKLALFHVDEELFDPDTGQSLGKDETYIGEVVVTRVKPKFSIVKIIKLEEHEEAAVGDILRKE